MAVTWIDSCSGPPHAWQVIHVCTCMGMWMWGDILSRERRRARMAFFSTDMMCGVALSCWGYLGVWDYEIQTMRNWSIKHMWVLICTHGVDDWAGRLRQKSFGTVTILPFLLHLQTANCQLNFLIHRNSRQLQRLSVHPWWVWLLFLPGPQKQPLGSSFWDLWGCLGGCSSASSFERGKDGEGCYTLSMCDGLKTPWVFLNSSYLQGTTLVKVQHICSSSSDLYRNNYSKNLFLSSVCEFHTDIATLQSNRYVQGNGITQNYSLLQQKLL